MKRKTKMLTVPLLVVALVQLSCDLPVIPGESGWERQRTECELAGGIWREEMVDEDLERWCEYPTTSGDPAQAGNGQEPVGTNPTDTPDLTVQEGSLEDCDATSLLSIRPVDLGWDDNSCACGYHLAITNTHSVYAVIIFSHVTIRMSPESGGTDDFWGAYIPDGIPAGGTMTDGGTGWVFEAWGGFYSTCALEDGGYSAPEYMHMDKVFARVATPTCAWINEPSEYEARAITVPDSCNP